MNTVPPATAGEDWKIGKPTEPVHSGWQVAWPQPAAEKALSFPSLLLNEVCEPTYTIPFATVGESMIWASEVDFHRGVVHRLCPHPDAGNAQRTPSLEPMYTTSSTTAGEEKS